MKWVRFIVTAALAIALVYFLNNKLWDIPPIGKFFSPFTGFWQNNESGKISPDELRIPGLKNKVTILLDNNLVPHIFAQNNYDLYLAQGYITAKYRLWQMEFQTHAAAGRICEIIGDKALEYDRHQRRFGMVYGAQNSVKEMEKDPESIAAAEAYTLGVNAWINQLSEKDLPVEYKLLNYHPEPWTVLKCALLLKYMTYDLAGYSDDFHVTNVLKQYGQETIDSLFVNRPFVMDPTIPSGTAWDSSPLPLPSPAESAIAGISQFPFSQQPNPENGSNNWAVSGNKTKSGYPILCGDPHLSLNLPSLWFQVQLVSPDCNVTGASLPGTPCVIIGFNQEIAWSETNVDADVLDWYSVKFKDAACDEYFFNNEWRKTEKLIETIKIRGQPDVSDTVVYTHHGPVVAMNGKPFRDYIPRGYAMRWLGHDGSQELKSFLELNRAGNYDEYVSALKYFSCPAQNFIYADNEKNVAIWVNGKYPLKWKNQGKFLMDGSNAANDWQAWIPHEQNPHVKNPGRGFVSSANQSPVDESYPYYLNWRFESFTRGHRINKMLGQMSAITAEDMRKLQFDNKNVTAETVLPAMLALLDEKGMNESQQQLIAILRNWDHEASTESIGQTIFQEWWNNLRASIWNDEFGADSLARPEAEISMRTVTDNINQKWIDNVTTPNTETLNDLVNQTFFASLDSLRKNYGDAGNWKWAQVKNTHINHLLRIPAFSRTFLNTPGNSGIVNATGTDHGPSWRMIVEMGQQVHAYGIYPGGQSGNAGSPFYDNMIDRWSKGEQNELLILSAPDEKKFQDLIRYYTESISMLLFFLIAVGSFLIQLVLPWWSMTIIAFGCSFFMGIKPFQTFSAGLLGCGVVWLVMALFIHFTNGDLMTNRIAILLTLPAPAVLYAASFLVAGLVGGISALAGFYLKRILNPEKEKPLATNTPS